jgi:hypothetical protein
VRQSFNIFYSANIDNCSDLRFCANCIGCHECIDCDNLINQSYCINNTTLPKDEYLVQKAELLKHKDTFPQKKYTTFERMGNIQAPESTGKGIINSQNITNGYCVLNVKDSKNLTLSEGGAGGSSNFYDSIDIGEDAHHYYAACQ